MQTKAQVSRKDIQGGMQVTEEFKRDNVMDRGYQGANSSQHG